MSRLNRSTANQARPQASANPKWQQYDTKESHETDGFQIVAHKKPLQSSIAKGLSALPYRGPPVGRSKPGVTRSYYKEEFLPVGEQNPLRLEAQKSKKYPKTMFKDGMIVRAPLHEQDVHASTNPPDHTITESHYGRIHTKFRKMIIVGLYDAHYVAVPIYSYEGKGLEFKKKDEYISVQDHRQQPPTVEKQSGLGVLVTEKLNTDVSRYHPRSAAHITSPHSRKYDGHCVIEGQISEISLRLLLKEYNQRTPSVKPR